MPEVGQKERQVEYDRMSEYVYSCCFLYNYIYICMRPIHTHRWYVGMMCQGGDQSKKVFSHEPPS